MNQAHRHSNRVSRKLHQIKLPHNNRTCFATPLIAVALMISLSGCRSHGVRAPKADLPPMPLPGISSVAVNIEIPTATISATIEQEAKKKPYSGTTGPMGMRFQAEKSIEMAKISYTTTVKVPRIVEDWVEDKVVSKIPFVGPVIKKIRRKIEKTVYDPVDKLVEKDIKLADIKQFDHLPGFKLVSKYISWIEEKIETKAQLNYKADFDRVNKLSFNGSVLKISVTENWHLSADVINPIPGTRIKGALAVDGQSSLSVNAKIRIKNDGGIACDLDDGSLRYDTTRLAIPGIDINFAEALKLQEYVDVQKQLLKRVIEYAASKFVLQKQIDDQLEKVNISGRAKELANQLKGQKALKGGIFLDLAPNSATIGQPFGVDTARGNELFIPVGIATPIRVAFVGSNQPAPKPFDQIKEVPVIIADSIPPKFDLQLAGDVSTDALSEALKKALTDVWKEKGYARYGFTPGKPEIYPTIVGNKRAVAVVVILLKNGKPDTYLSAFGIPKLSATAGSAVNNLLTFDDLTWSAESETFIIDKLAWLAENFAYKYLLGKLQKASKVQLDGVHSKIKQNNPIHVDDGKIEANFKIESWNIKDVQIGDGFIRVEVTAQGTPTVRVK